MNAIVSDKGQVTIPKLIRDDLGLVPGSALNFIKDHGRIIVKNVVTKNPTFESAGFRLWPVR